MNKKIRNGLLLLGVVASLVALGCGGGDKKPTPEKPATKTEEPAKKAEAPQEVKKVKPVPKSPLYKYALHLDDEKKIPPMTDEIVAEFEKQAKPIKIAQKDDKKGRKGCWTFNSNKVNGAQVNTYRWTAELDGHHDSTFENDKGKKINEQHFCHIDITTNAADNKIKSVRVHKYHVTKDTGEKGKSEELYKFPK